MEYEFIHDAITGSAKAKFSFEHQVLGPWLEVEVANDADKLAEILTAIDQVETGAQQEVMIAGCEYALVVNKQDVHVHANASLNGDSYLPDELSADDMSFDMQDKSSCGIEDFRSILLSWAKFTKI